MVLGLPVAGLATLVIVAAFIVIVHRMSGIRYTPLERRRLRYSWSIVGLFGLGYAVLFATVRTAIPLYVAVFLGLLLVATWQLRRRDHWLVTFTADERERMPGRQDAMAAVGRRPAFRILVVAVLVAVAIVNLAAAIVER